MFGVEEVSTAGVEPRELTSGLVLSQAPEKPHFKEHPASTDLLLGAKRSRGLQLWPGMEEPLRCPAGRSLLALSPGCPLPTKRRALEAIYVLSARSQKQFNLG